MHRLLLCLSLLCLPLQAHDQHTLAAHQHGIAQLNIAAEGAQLALELLSPAANLLGFEQQPNSVEQQQQVQDLQRLLNNPQRLLNLPSSCQLQALELNSPLFSATEQHAPHNDIHASYLFDCAAQLPTQLDLSPLLQQFPAIEQVQLQLFNSQGQQSTVLTRKQTVIEL